MVFKSARWRRIGLVALGAGAVYGSLLAGYTRLPGTWAQAPAVTTTEPPRPTTRQLIGLDALQQRLGPETPTGRGVRVGHVEGDDLYLPNLRSERFRGLTLIHRGPRSDASGHADATAKILYGEGGLAPGIATVEFFPVGPWLGQGCLKLGTLEPPDPGEIKLFTHSWIGGENPAAAQALRRIDYLVDAFDVPVVAGVNNGRTTPVPALLASAYNVIAVGHQRGESSGGYTRVEIAGRCKPDIVAPGGLTSFATPVVSGVVARLLEAADRLGDERARRATVIKAVLLAGADKPANWRPAPGKPLDEHLGAGVVRLDASYDILTAGAASPAAGEHDVVMPLGWAWAELGRHQRHRYRLHVPQLSGPVSIVLAWHRRIEGGMARDPISGQPRWNDQSRLADLDLALLARDDQGQLVPFAQSASEVDNVEHLYFASLAPGTYTLEITRKDTLDESWDYALAWRVGEPHDAAEE